MRGRVPNPRPGPMPTQLGLKLAPRTRGGARPGAGRPKSTSPTGVPHARRPDHCPRHPVHVTLRLARHVLNLRSQRGFALVERALRQTNARGLVRIAHFSVQHDHMHLVVESADRRALAGGIKGFEVRLARRVNTLMRRRGRAFGAERYHTRVLTTPRMVRAVLAYVLNNRVHHAPDRFHRGRVDPFSSGPFFDGWSATPRRCESACRGTGPPILPASTWLLATGWKRAGLVPLPA
jgi:REP element-mobilizing transposase RayT